MDAKTAVGKSNAVPQRSAVKAPAPIVQTDMASLIQRAQAEPGTLSPADIMRLQGKLGNQAIMRLLDASAVKQQTLIQRDDDDDDPSAPLLGGSESSSDEYEEEEDDTQSKMDKLIAIGAQVRTFYDMHKNYKKYEKYLSATPWWGKLKEAWGLANKVLGWVSNIDPTGISKIVAKVSKAVHSIVGYIDEAITLYKDKDLQEQVTPLLSHDMDFGTIKSAVKEAFTLKNAIESAVEALT